MGWKNWPSWLKGGLIGGGVVFIAVLIGVFFNILSGRNFLSTGSSDLLSVLLTLLFIPFIFIFSWLIHIFYNIGFIREENIDNIFIYFDKISWIAQSIIEIVLVFFIYFLIGALIGFIIGKFKEKKK